jgi:hypothetical protein
MTTSLQEKRGIQRRSDVDNVDFKETIDKLHLVDIYTSNGCRTLNNRRGGACHIRVRLDRLMVSYSILQRKASIL